MTDTPETPQDPAGKSTPRRRRRRQPISVARSLPNMVTLLALCAGLTAVRYGLNGEWEKAVGAVLIAGAFDGMDGRLARLLRGTSRFGAELDSLCDVINFGVIPALLAYIWVMQDAGGIGWVICLLYAVCTVLRLARFNTMLEDPDPPPFTNAFFVGVPAPAAAGLVMVPLVLSFILGPGTFDRASVMGAVLVTVSFLMISRLPTFSFKRLRIPQRFVLPMMVFVPLFAAFLVTNTWVTLSLMGLVYVALLPVSFLAYRRARRAWEAES